MRRAIRRYLRLDTWGWDIFRLKRRVGKQQRILMELDDRIAELQRTSEAALNWAVSVTANTKVMVERIRVLEDATDALLLFAELHDEAEEADEEAPGREEENALLAG